MCMSLSRFCTSRISNSRNGGTFHRSCTSSHIDGELFLKKNCFLPFCIILVQRSTAASSLSSVQQLSLATPILSRCSYQDTLNILWLQIIETYFLLNSNTHITLITLVSPSFHKSHKSLLLNSTTHKTSITFVLLPSLSFTAFRLNSLVPLLRLYCILHIRGQPLPAPLTFSRKWFLKLGIASKANNYTQQTATLTSN